MAEEQFVVFRLGKEEYAISITQVKEIIQYKEATKLPSTPAFMEGIISLRGKIIPVMDLVLRLNLATAKVEDKRALIIEAAGKEVGIIVDEVTEVIRLQDSAIDLAPTSITNEYIKGIGKAGSRLLILLDVNKLFSEDEILELQQTG